MPENGKVPGGHRVRRALWAFRKRLLHKRARDHLVDVGEVLLLHVGGNKIAQRAGGEGVVLQRAVERRAAEGAVDDSLHGGDDHGGVVGDLRADDALVLAEDVGRLADVVDLDFARGGVGRVDGLARAGVDGGSVAEEDVSALGDQLSGKFLALRGVGEGVGIGDVEQLDGLAFLLGDVLCGFFKACLLYTSPSPRDA